jgi:hypothetical protein
LIQYFSFYEIKIKEKESILSKYALYQEKKKRKLTVSEDLFQDIQSFAPSISEHLKTLLPPNMSFITQYIIAVSCDDSNIYRRSS